MINYQKGDKVGRYAILRPIGEGGSSIVYLAHWDTMQQDVAIKFLKTDPDYPQARERFQQEARLLAKLQHPRLLPIYDFDGNHEPPYIVMRYIPEGTLKDLKTDRGGSLPLLEVVQLLTQIVEALDYIHRQGVIHRDIKPSNIMIDAEGNVLLADLGLAHFAMTTGHTPAGTPGYMPPEQVIGGKTTYHADIYALGVTLFELLTGKSPFFSAGEAQYKEVPAATSINPSLPSTVDYILRKAMARKPADRYRNIKTLLSDFLSLSGLREPKATHTLYQPRQQEIGTRLSEERQVTILYATWIEYIDLISGGNNIEDNTQLNQLLFDLENTIVTYGGQPKHSEPDFTIAYWGLDQSRGMDPKQAVQAALTIQRVMQQFQEIADDSQALPIRITITTGSMLVDANNGDNGHYLRDPLTTEVKRLERETPLGDIRISHNTYLAVRDLSFLMETFTPLLLQRGHQLQTYLVKGEQAIPPEKLYTIEGVQTKMVGRQQELDLLLEALDVAVEDKRTQVVTITGDMGLGKSRLLYEFGRQVAVEDMLLELFQGQATPGMRHQPYALLRDVFSRYFDIQDNDEGRLVRQKMGQGIINLMEQGNVINYSLEKVSYIGRLLGFEPFQTDVFDVDTIFYKRAIDYLVEFFVTVARVKSVVIRLENLHWADKNSLDMLEYLAAHQHISLLIILVTRQRQSAWLEQPPFYTTHIHLNPLTRRQSRQLVREILQRAEHIPTDLQTFLVSRAGGNPLFMEEMVKLLIEDRVIIIHKEDPFWRIEIDRLRPERIPAMLTNLLQASWDNLFPVAQTVLRWAAVIGNVFWDEAVAYLATTAGQSIQVNEHLAWSVQEQIIHKSEAPSFHGTQEYLFNYHILRDFIYKSIPGQQRRTYHEMVASWLIERSNERRNEFASMIAYHWRKAGQEEDAAHYLFEAGKQATRQYAHAEAIDSYSQALDLIQENPLKWALLKARGQSYQAMGDLDKALDNYLQYAEAETDDQRLDALLRISDVYSLMGEPEQALHPLQETHELAKRLGKITVQIEAQIAIGELAWRLGQLWESDKSLQEALMLAMRQADRQHQMAIWYRRGLTLLELGNMHQAKIKLETCLALAREEGNRQMIILSLSYLGHIYQSLYHTEAAMVAYTEALDEIKSLPTPEVKIILYRYLGRSLCQQGRPEIGFQRLYEAVELGTLLGESVTNAATLYQLALAELDQGHVAKALAQATQLATGRQLVDAPLFETHAAYILGLCYEAKGERETAVNHLEKALTLARERQQQMFSWQIQVALGQLQTEQTACLEYYKTAIDIIQQIAAPFDDDPIKEIFLTAPPIQAISATIDQGIL